MPRITTGAPAPPLEEDVFCRCGYNLRGLPRDGRCPECGRPIQQAIEAARGTVNPTEARWMMGSCACFLLSLYLMHHHLFVRRPRAHLVWILAAAAMLAGTGLLAFPERLSRWLSLQAFHDVALRALVVVWLALALLVRPDFQASLIQFEHSALPLILVPAGTLHCLLFVIARWHDRLGNRSIGGATRALSWLFPATLILYAARPYGYFAFLYVLPEEVLRWASSALFFVNAFLLGVTWYASLLAMRKPANVDSQY